MSLTKPAIFATAADRDNPRAHFILKIVSADADVWYLSDTSMQLGSVQVYDADLQLSEVVSASSVNEEGVIYPQISGSVSNVPIYPGVSGSKVEVTHQDFVSSLDRATIDVYLCLGQDVTSISDCLLVFSGKAREDWEYNAETASFNAVDLRAFDHIELPLKLIEDAYPDAAATRSQRSQPLVYGTFARDDFLAGGLALAEEVEDDLWIIAGHPIKSWTNQWLFSAALGDFMELIKLATTTLNGLHLPTATSILLNSVEDFRSGDKVVIDRDTLSEEVITLGKVTRRTFLVVESGGLQFGHSTGATVEIAYMDADFEGRAEAHLKRQVVDISQGSKFLRVDAYRVFIHVHPIGQSNSPVWIQNPKRSTFVNSNSASGQKVLSVDFTGGWHKGLVLKIDRGGANDETKTVASVDSDSQVTLTVNLVNTHNASDSPTVEPDDLRGTENNSLGINNVRDRSASSYLTMKVGIQEGGGAGVSNLNLEFPDLASSLSNLENDIGFIEEYGFKWRIDVEPGVTWTAAAIRLRLGDETDGASHTRHFGSGIAASGSHQTVDFTPQEATLKFLHGPGDKLQDGTSASTSGQQNFIITTTRFLHPGQRIVLDEGFSTTPEEEHEIQSVDDGVKIVLVEDLKQNHTLGTDIFGVDAIGIFWRLKSGDNIFNRGAQVQIRITTGSPDNDVDDPVARVFDFRFRFKALIFNRPFGEGVLAFQAEEQKKTIDPSIKTGGDAKGFGDDVSAEGASG